MAGKEERPKIGITVQPRRGLEYYVPYRRAVTAAGAEPVDLVPGTKALPDLDGLLLPGGWDVDPSFYGERRDEKLGETDPESDETELALFRQARERELPVLGICRGQQVINVAMGGSLVQHLEDHDARTLGRSHLAQRLALVASASGGKTGVHLPAAETYLGAYHQPTAAIVDEQTPASPPDPDLAAARVAGLNDLAWSAGLVWANVAGTYYLAGIDPDSGEVTDIVNARPAVNIPPPLPRQLLCPPTTTAPTSRSSQRWPGSGATTDHAGPQWWRSAPTMRRIPVRIGGKTEECRA